MQFRTSALALAAATCLSTLAACGSMGMSSSSGSAGNPTFNQMSLPDSVRVPAGNRVALETVGVGELTYECRARANMAGQFEWALSPEARLLDRSDKQVGKYYGPPATWESLDGSKITGTQLAVAPAGDGNLPFQLVKANPATGAGAMQNVTYVQRVTTKGGAAPAATACGASAVGQKQLVKYQADYIFYKAM